MRALISTGSAAEIAQQLGTSDNTVKKRIASLYAKLGARNRAEALEAAVGMGFIDPE